MKTIKGIVCGAMIAAPLFLLPAQSRANGFGDFFRNLFGRDSRHTEWNRSGDRHFPQADPPAPAAGQAAGNSVPISGGILLLIVAGLGLGTKIMYNKGKQNVDNLL
jgi:hypothetical protein